MGRASRTPPFCAQGRHLPAMCRKPEGRHHLHFLLETSPQQLCLWRVSGGQPGQEATPAAPASSHDTFPRASRAQPRHKAFAQALPSARSTPPSPHLCPLVIAVKQMISSLATENNESSECQEGKNNIEMAKIEANVRNYLLISFKVIFDD